MFLIKIYIKESYINYYHTIIQMCGQYCILAPTLGCRLMAHFKNFRKTSTFSLKDERVLLLSHTLRAA